MIEKPTPARADKLEAAQQPSVMAEHRLGVVNHNLNSLDALVAATEHIDRQQRWSRHQVFATVVVEAANLEVARQIDVQNRLGGATVEQTIKLANQGNEVVNG